MQTKFYVWQNYAYILIPNEQFNVHNIDDLCDNDVTLLWHNNVSIPVFVYLQ